MNQKTALALFKTEVTNRAKEIDPNSEMDWHALTVGWAIAKGMTPDDAHAFATFVRYNTDLA